MSKGARLSGLEKKDPPKVLIWDIEASGLRADFAFIFCIGWKWLHLPEVNLIKIRNSPTFAKDPTNDEWVLERFASVLERADMQVTHYGTRFDYPFINTRRMIQGKPPVALIPHFDTWRVARNQLLFGSNRLANIQGSMHYAVGEARHEKTTLEKQHWLKAAAGHVPALRYVEAHCRADILVTEKVYLSLRPFAPGNIPNLSKTDGSIGEGCPACGEDALTRQGYRLTSRGRYRKMQCQNCGHWCSLPLPRGSK